MHAVDVPKLDVDESTSAARICFNLTNATPAVSTSSPRPTKNQVESKRALVTLRPVLVEEHDPFQKRLLSLRGDGERMALPGLTERHRIAIKPSSAAILLLLLSRLRAAPKQVSINSRASNLSLRKERKINRG